MNCRKTPHWTGMVSLLLVSIMTSAHASDDAAARFHQGNRLYQEGDYQAAIRAYESILDSGRHSAGLYYNLGNAEFKRGSLGRAALNYERALRLAPGDEDAQVNLQLAYSLTVDEITPLPRFWLFSLVDAWLRLIPPAWLLGLTGFCYLAAMSGWMARVLARGAGARKWALRLCLVCLLSCAVLALTWSAAAGEAGRSDEGIVLESEAVVRSAPGEDPGLKIFEIHEGTKVRVAQRAGEWSEIVLADGKVGWVRSDAYEII